MDSEQKNELIGQSEGEREEDNRSGDDGEIENGGNEEIGNQQTQSDESEQKENNKDEDSISNGENSENGNQQNYENHSENEKNENLSKTEQHEHDSDKEEHEHDSDKEEHENGNHSENNIEINEEADQNNNEETKNEKVEDIEENEHPDNEQSFDEISQSDQASKRSIKYDIPNNEEQNDGESFDELQSESSTYANQVYDEQQNNELILHDHEFNENDGLIDIHAHNENQNNNQISPEDDQNSQPLYPHKGGGSQTIVNQKKFDYPTPESLIVKPKKGAKAKHGFIKKPRIQRHYPKATKYNYISILNRDSEFPNEISDTTFYPSKELKNLPNFEEPETIEAMERLGYVKDDLIPKAYDEVPGDDELRAKIIPELEKRRIQMIDEVMEERQRVLNGEPEKKLELIKPKRIKKKSFKGKNKGKLTKRRKGKKANAEGTGDVSLDPNDSPAKTDQGAVSQSLRRHKRKRKKKVQLEIINPDIDVNSVLNVSKPKAFKKKAPIEPPDNEIRRKKIDEELEAQQRKAAEEIQKKQLESEVRVQLCLEAKRKKNEELKIKRRKKSEEIAAHKKEKDRMRDQEIQKVLQKMNTVEQRQAEIRRQRLEEILKRRQIREERRKAAEEEKKKNEQEKLKKLQEVVDRTERQSALALENKSKKRSPAKLVIPNISPIKRRK